MDTAVKKRIIILFAGRFPSEKAAALFVDLNARSLVDAGADVIVLAPRRLGRHRMEQVPYSLVFLPTLDLSHIPILWNIANYITVAVYSKVLFFWLLLKSNKSDVIISNDVVPLLVASLIRKNLMYEMHDFPDRARTMYGILFRRVRWILATNEWKAKEIQRKFAVDTKKIFVERNAVDISAFGQMTRHEAREKLGLDGNARFAVYTGHLYEWKGADTLAQAAKDVPDVTVVFVGGTDSDVARFRTTYSDILNIKIIGHVPHENIPIWQSAADVLVLPNSGKEEISVHYTSPMKLFEYMASARPIVASDLPSIREILPTDAGYFAISDNPESFASEIYAALSDSTRASRARDVVVEYSWSKRAQRILSRFI